MSDSTQTFMRQCRAREAEGERSERSVDTAGSVSVGAVYDLLFCLYFPGLHSLFFM